MQQTLQLYIRICHTLSDNPYLTLKTDLVLILHSEGVKKFKIYKMTWRNNKEYNDKNNRMRINKQGNLQK